MTLTADHAFESGAAIGIPYKLDGNRSVLRLLARVAAMTAAFVAVFVWLAPGATWEADVATWEADVMLFKLGVSIFAGYSAMALWQASLPPLPPSVEIDTANSELRLVRADSYGPRDVVERCRFDDLQMVELRGRHIAFWAPGGRLLAEITLSNATAHATLLAALRQAGKLA